jgi:hypothetical protein
MVVVLATVVVRVGVTTVTVLAGEDPPAAVADRVPRLDDAPVPDEVPVSDAARDGDAGAAAVVVWAGVGEAVLAGEDPPAAVADRVPRLDDAPVRDAARDGDAGAAAVVVWAGVGEAVELLVVDVVEVPVGVLAVVLVMKGLCAGPVR